MTETRLSNLMTFFFKFIFPTLWLGGWGIGTVCVWFAPSEWRPGVPPLAIRLLVTAIFVAAFWLFRIQVFPLKRVTLVPEGLRVSNYLDEELVPFEEIAEVRESKWSKGRDITLVLHRPCRFGTRVRFMPKTELFLLWGDHPVATLLRERAGLLPSH